MPMHVHTLKREHMLYMHSQIQKNDVSVSAPPPNVEKHANSGISAVINDLASIDAKPNLNLILPKVE